MDVKHILALKQKIVETDALTRSNAELKKLINEKDAKIRQLESSENAKSDKSDGNVAALEAKNKKLEAKVKSLEACLSKRIDQDKVQASFHWTSKYSTFIIFCTKLFFCKVRLFKSAKFYEG